MYYGAQAEALRSTRGLSRIGDDHPGHADLRPMTRSQLRYTYGSSWFGGHHGQSCIDGEPGNYASGKYLGISQDSTPPAIGDTNPGR